MANITLFSQIISKLDRSSYKSLVKEQSCPKIYLGQDWC